MSCSPRARPFSQAWPIGAFQTPGGLKLGWAGTQAEESNPRPYCHSLRWRPSFLCEVSLACPVERPGMKPEMEAGLGKSLDPALSEAFAPLGFVVIRTKNFLVFVFAYVV